MSSPIRQQGITNSRRMKVPENILRAVEPFDLARIHIADGPFPPSILPCSPARSAPLEPSTPEGFFLIAWLW